MINKSMAVVFLNCIFFSNLHFIIDFFHHKPCTVFIISKYIYIHIILRTFGLNLRAWHIFKKYFLNIKSKNKLNFVNQKYIPLQHVKEELILKLNRNKIVNYIAWDKKKMLFWINRSFDTVNHHNSIDKNFLSV